MALVNRSSMAFLSPDSSPPTPPTLQLQPVLRLIHCIQKERGASCALVASLGQQLSTGDSTSDEKQYEKYLRTARTASNSAISPFYTIGGCNTRAIDQLEIAAILHGVRVLVDGGGDEKDERNEFFFHDVFVAYNNLISGIIKVFVVNEVMNRKNCEEIQFSDPNAEYESRRNAKIAMSLLELILDFVQLKESFGMERAILSGLMASGMRNMTDANNDELVKSIDMRQPRVVNDLVMIVENQHQIMRYLGNQSGLSYVAGTGLVPVRKEDIHLDGKEIFLDGNYRALLRLLGDTIRPSDAMRSVQDHIRKDFDINKFRQAMSMDEFWRAITLYMDRLHSTELLILEELDSCDGRFDGLDLLSLQEAKPAMSEAETQDDQKTLVLTTSNEDRPELEEWEISLYDVEFNKRIGRGSGGTTYQARYCNQDVAVKVAATSEMGLFGFTNELSSLKKLHHTNIIRFLGAVYNPSPLTYCLVLEYCNGGDLAMALAANNTPPKFFTTVTSGVANGLSYLHKMKYMHRDIKPGNVLLSGDTKSGNFVAKLTDFGLAVKVQNASVQVGDLTAETGTYRYMAPEVIRHECYDYSADVYSFGILTWEMITHERPFEPLSQIEAAGLVAIEQQRPPFPQDIPMAVKFLIENCWKETPSTRVTVEDVIQSLDDLSSNMTALTWLAAPDGHPVYKQLASVITDFQDMKAVQPVKKRSSIFFRKKK